MAIPGITPEIADIIIDYRQNKEIGNILEVGGIPAENVTLMAPYIDTSGSITFGIEAVGHKGGEKGGYAIKATVTIAGTNIFKYVYYKSPANIKQ